MKKPLCKIKEEDSNVFTVVDKVSKALKDAGQKELAKDFKDKAFASVSFDAVLALAGKYVEVK